MATTMIPEVPSAPRPDPNPVPASGGLRFVLVRANLMPDEVLSARQAEVVRKQVLLGLVALVILLIAWFGVSWWQTNSAQGDLTDLQRQSTGLQNQTHQFAPLVQAQGQTDMIHAQLQKLMVGDLSWRTMLTTLRANAPTGVALTNVAGTVTAGAASAPAGATPPVSLNASGQLQIGTLTIAGTAATKNEVAAYADKLAAVKGLTAPLITSVTTTGNSITFTMTVIITADALGGRYAVIPAALTGGK
jgi:Tfp pilus assembly protein PilN